VSFGLSTKHPVGIILWLVGSTVSDAWLDGRRGCGARLSGFGADRKRAAAPATRLPLRVEGGLGLGLALLLLQTALLDQRRTHHAAALLADPASIVSNLLQPLLREQQFLVRRVHEAALLLAIWPSEVRIITHRGSSIAAFGRSRGVAPPLTLVADT
jgi:hypothetical protein